MCKYLLFGFLLCFAFSLKAQNINTDTSGKTNLIWATSLTFLQYQPQKEFLKPFYDDIPFDPCSPIKPFSFQSATTVCLGDACNNFKPKIYLSPLTNQYKVSLINSPTFGELPAYTQGFFCDFEDHINRKRQFRIDFSVK